ncbi:hypothetical protein CL620_02715 [archaeon]|jgi:hypothetical protein|nr:hypothetical protein [archaeon]|tara:strand:+ start:733 stop:1359 length:627 start_codon:yes stop_codon:yes gene_type:complete
MKYKRRAKSSVILRIRAVDTQEGNIEGVVGIGGFETSRRASDIFIPFQATHSRDIIPIEEDPFFYGTFKRLEENYRRAPPLDATELEDYVNCRRKDRTPFYKIPVSKMKLTPGQLEFTRNLLKYGASTLPALLTELTVVEFDIDNASQLRSARSGFPRIPRDLCDRALSAGKYYHGYMEQNKVDIQAYEGPKRRIVNFWGWGEFNHFM